MIAEVSLKTAKYVRPIVKMPMISILTCCGVAVGLNLVCFTFIGELLQDGSFSDVPLLVTFLIAVGMICSICLLFVTNYVVSIYD